jgi:hypothetical protein
MVQPTKCAKHHHHHPPSQQAQPRSAIRGRKAWPVHGPFSTSRSPRQEPGSLATVCKVHKKCSAHLRTRMGGQSEERPPAYCATHYLFCSTSRAACASTTSRALKPGKCTNTDVQTAGAGQQESYACFRMQTQACCLIKPPACCANCLYSLPRTQPKPSNVGANSKPLTPDNQDMHVLHILTVSVLPRCHKCRPRQQS